MKIDRKEIPIQTEIIFLFRVLQLEKPESPYYNVLFGSAYSDLPPRDTLEKVRSSYDFYNNEDIFK